MPHNTFHFLAPVADKIQDMMYFLMFGIPFMMMAVQDVGTKTMQPEHSFKWTVGTIITLVVLALTGVQKFISLEEHLKTNVGHTNNNTQELKRREIYIDGHARHSKDIEQLEKDYEELQETVLGRQVYVELVLAMQKDLIGLQDDIDKVHIQHEKDEKFAKERLENEVILGAERHKNMEDRWKIQMSALENTIKPLLPKDGSGRWTWAMAQQQIKEEKNELNNIKNLIYNEIGKFENRTEKDINVIQNRMTNAFIRMNDYEENCNMGNKPTFPGYQPFDESKLEIQGYYYDN